MNIKLSYLFFSFFCFFGGTDEKKEIMDKNFLKKEKSLGINRIKKDFYEERVL